MNVKQLITKFNPMRKSKQTCRVSGIKTAPENFYTNQVHTKAVDNIRRTTGATTKQLTRMFNQLNAY